MPRARGDGPYKSSADFIRHSYSRKLENSPTNYPGWNDRREWEKFSRTRPLLRTRFSGPVGPEPDWSVRESDLPRDLVWKIIGKQIGDIKPNSDGERQCSLFFPQKFNLKVTSASHGCICTAWMTDADVKAWSKAAYELGFQFNGRRGYSAKSIKDGLTFRQKKVIGQVPCHRRSEFARIRRAARRGKRDCLIQSRPADSLFCTRYRLSAKECRKAWFTHRLTGGTLDFQEYRSTYVGRGITLFPPRCHGVIPNIVFRSLKRIYSTPTKLVGQKLWFKPDADLRYTLEARLPERKLPPLIWRKGSVVMSHPFTREFDSPRSTIPRFSLDTDLPIDWHRTDLAGRFIGRFSTETPFSEW